MNHNPNNAQIWIPLDNGWCMIPRGLSEDDYALLLETLALWKPKLVTKKINPAPASNAEGNADYPNGGSSIDGARE